MDVGRCHLQVDGIGTANVLAVSRLHDVLGLSQKKCIEKILTAPNLLLENIPQEKAQLLEKSLSNVGLKCRLSNQTPSQQQEKYEVAAYISKADKLHEFAVEVAAFTGQTGDQVIASLAKTPAVILGQVSGSVADELLDRFQKPGVELIKSCPQKALYTVVAYSFNDGSGIEQHYQNLGLRRAASNGSELNGQQGAQVWQAEDVDLGRAETIWAKASELHVPIVIHNHDYMRFDVQLNHCHSSNLADIQTLLQEYSGIPEGVFPQLFDHLPILVGRLLTVAGSRELLQKLSATGGSAEAILLSGSRFNLNFPKWRKEYTSALKQIAESVMARAVAMPAADSDHLRLPLNASLHQAIWIQLECSKRGIDCQLSRAEG